jgi:hypothetical protein
MSNTTLFFFFSQVANARLYLIYKLPQLRIINFQRVKQAVRVASLSRALEDRTFFETDSSFVHNNNNNNNRNERRQRRCTVNRRRFQSLAASCSRRRRRRTSSHRRRRLRQRARQRTAKRRLAVQSASLCSPENGTNDRIEFRCKY